MVVLVVAEAVAVAVVVIVVIVMVPVVAERHKSAIFPVTQKARPTSQRERQ